jgi:hypothetical protein
VTYNGEVSKTPPFAITYDDAGTGLELSFTGQGGMDACPVSGKNTGKQTKADEVTFNESRQISQGSPIDGRRYLGVVPETSLSGHNYRSGQRRGHIPGTTPIQGLGGTVRIHDVKKERIDKLYRAMIRDAQRANGMAESIRGLKSR